MFFVISQAEDVNKKNGEADALGNHVSTGYAFLTGHDKSPGDFADL